MTGHLPHFPSPLSFLSLSSLSFSFISYVIVKQLGAKKHLLNYYEQAGSLKVQHKCATVEKSTSVFFLGL